jgi:hypothetical protein
MKNTLWLLLVVFGSLLHAEFEQESIETPQHVVILSQEEIDAILRRDELYVYFGPEVCSAIRDLPYIHRHMIDQDFSCQYLTAICDQIAQGKTTAPFDLVDAALYEANEYLASNQTEIKQEDATQLLRNLEEYYAKLEAGAVDLVVSPAENEDVDTTTLRSGKCKSFHSAGVCKLSTTCLNVNCNAIIGGNLTVDGNSLVAGDLTVLGTIHTATTSFLTSPVELIGTPQQACIIFLDSTMTEKARICTSTIPGDNGLFVSVDGGATQNLRVNNEGGTVLAAPTAGAALSVTGNAGASAIIATGNGTTAAPALTLIGNPVAAPTDAFLTIDASGIVRQSTGSFIGGCQAGPLTIGTTDTSSLTFATNGCTPRIVIDEVVIQMPTAGEALTVFGNILIPAANAAETQGILKLGGTGATRVNLYEFGTRNFVAGSGAVNSSVTGADNISIGTIANSTLVAANNTIAIGTGSRATATDSIAIGDSPRATATQAIVLGSADSSSTGTAPSAVTVTSIVIGSASGTQTGAIAGGLNAISIGGSDGLFSGANGGGARCIAIGVAPLSQSDSSILIGSASGTVGGLPPRTVERTAICIGSAQGTQRASLSFNTSSIAIGGSDGISPGASAQGMRSIAIGLNANTAGTGATSAIVLGSASAVAGGLAPVGSAGGSIAIGSANGALRGALASAAATIALGGSSGVVAGASATGARSAAIGNGAAVTTADRILLGNVAATAVRVGIGIAAPAAKLDIVGAAGTPVMRINQVAVAIANAPRWPNPSTSAVAGTPIHYNASNQLFGFTSSERYKTNIRPIGSESEIIYQLNPVLYDPKEEYGEGHDIPGFIAEEVYPIAPNLVILSSDNMPENIAYNSLHAFAIEELQKHQQQLIVHNTLIGNHSSAIDALLAAAVALQTRIDQYSN